MVVSISCFLVLGLFGLVSCQYGMPMQQVVPQSIQQPPQIQKLIVTCTPNAVIPHPVNCNQFIKCGVNDDSENTLLNCTLPTVFNIRVSDCDKPKNVECTTYDMLTRPSSPSKSPQNSAPGLDFYSNINMNLRSIIRVLPFSEFRISLLPK
jgi:hypothetical protein